jgi:sugar (pentulose or hexulose) kinase
MNDLLLSIDVGTQSTRCMIFNHSGVLLHKIKSRMKPCSVPHPGWAEMDPGYYWEIICRSLQRLQSVKPELLKNVAGMALTTQRNTIVCLDDSGEPLRPAIVWMDERTTDDLEPVPGIDRLLHKIVGMEEAVTVTQADCEINWIKRNQPWIWEKTAHYLFLSGYLLYRLTGRYIDSTGSQIGYIPFDYRKMRWSRSGDFKWHVFPVEREKLPDLVQPGEKIGVVSQKASRDTGLPAGLPVIASASDKGCETIGVGATTPDIAALSLGTTATVQTTTSKYVEVTPFIPPYPSAIPGQWNTEVQIFRGFWMLNWFKQEFGCQEVEQALLEGKAPEEFINHLLDSAPPGALGLVLQPYWSPGLKEPGPEAKGAIIGFGDVHKKSHLYRAIVEGLGYALLDGMLHTAARSKTDIVQARVAGGGSQSDEICQVLADILGLPVVRTAVYEASGLGAAINAAAGLGMFPDHSSAISNMVHSRVSFEPTPETSALYQRLYNEVYTRMYQKLKPLYKKIRDITGYPH